MKWRWGERRRRESGRAGPRLWCGNNGIRAQTFQDQGAANCCEIADVILSINHDLQVYVLEQSFGRGS